MLDKMPPGAKILFIIALGIMMIYGGFRYSVRLTAGEEIVVTGEAAPLEKPASEEAEEKSMPKMLTVHVVGAVCNPGVYTLDEGKRIDDAVKLAGPTEKADLSLINLAALLQDGKQIYVPEKGEELVNQGIPSVSNPRRMININTAGAAELDLIPGIGPALARRIIEYRESSGPFGIIEDITKVSGIGPAMFEKMKDRITVD
jgi:competence protein ComEA